VKLAKARPGAINYASAGTGSSTFLAAELFKEAASIDMVHVPYRGGGEALTSVMSGETSVYFSPVAIALPLIRERKFRPVAVTSVRRLAAMPELPTIAEAGYRGYVAGNWFGLLVPVKTRPEIITTVRSAALSVLENEQSKQRLVELGYVPVGDQPGEFEAHIRSEIEKLGRVVRRTGVKAE
jgi:tripartite-type tricarboxylate transporter receptor subunit TctC